MRRGRVHDRIHVFAVGVEAAGKGQVAAHDLAGKDIAGIDGVVGKSQAAHAPAAAGRSASHARSDIAGSAGQEQQEGESILAAPWASPRDEEVIAADERRLAGLGYKQELRRGMGAFSNYALSLSIICILAGGVTSFHQGLRAWAAPLSDLGWPLVCLFSLAVAATMGQVASSFPTAGGPHHWASILGGRGWGWTTGMAQPPRE